MDQDEASEDALKATWESAICALRQSNTLPSGDGALRDLRASWREAAGHAYGEIADCGRWTCACKSCVAMRDKIIATIKAGQCELCWGPCSNRRSRFCSPACKQKAYRSLKRDRDASR